MLYLFLALGGFSGAISRYFIAQKVGVGMGFPLSTSLINLSGCFVLGLFFTITLNLLTVNPAIRTGFGTGFLGAFTTFSTFSLETIQLILSGHLLEVVIYTGASLLGGVMMSGGGIWFARWIEVAARNKALSEEVE